MPDEQDRRIGPPRPGAWWIERGEGPWIARCASLAEPTGVGHAFSTRRCGRDGAELDLGSAAEHDVGVLAARQALAAAAGLGRRDPARIRQVHGATVLSARALPDSSEQPPSADGVVAHRADASSAVPAVRTADCVPVLLASRDGAAVAAVHAGWRGTAAGIAVRAVAALTELGPRPENLLAALGPSIGPCCYVVGPEVVEAVARASGLAPERLARRVEAGRTVDLRAALAHQLVRAGLSPESVTAAPWCTACRADLFFSYRREGAGAGRQMALIGWRPEDDA